MEQKRQKYEIFWLNNSFKWGISIHSSTKRDFFKPGIHQKGSYIEVYSENDLLF